MEKLFTVKTLAAATGFGQSTIRDLIRNRELAAIRLTHGERKPNARPPIRIRLSDWEDWVKRNREAAVDEQPQSKPRADYRDVPGADRYMQ